jgi:phosphoglycerate dehydrogenase-like enzyme
MTLRVAILDDYLGLARPSTDWSPLERRCDVTTFDRPLAHAPDAARILAPFDIVCLMRERMPFGDDLMAQLPNLKMICVTGPYCRPLDIEAAVRRGIVVSHTELRGTYRKATCELTWGLILAVARRIPQECESMRRGGWQTSAGFTLAGRTLGLLGLGRQGRHMVPIAKAFGMDAIAWSPNLTSEAAAAVGVQRVEKDELFARSDVLSVHLVLGERSRGLVDAAMLARMKRSAILVNAARGAIVDEAALVEALRTGRIAGAGLDVYAQEPLPADHPLRSLPNVVLTPHQGHNVREFYEVAFTDVVENITAFLDGAPIRLLDPARNASLFAP